MSEMYTGFAEVYDTFMDNVPYEKWSEFICEQLMKYNILPFKDDGKEPENDKEQYARNLRIEKATILDLGCGTGTLTRMLADKGYDTIGIDLSEEMLQIAMSKDEKGNLYLCQDMREFELFSTVGAVVCVCDSINYLLEEQDILQTFSLVNNYLFPKGLFIFDFNTVHKYRDVIGNTTIAENREDCSFIWDNYYHDGKQINEYDLTIFVKDEYEEEKDSQYEDGDEAGYVAVPYLRFKENHYQRGYTLETMKRLVMEAGLTFIEAVDGDTLGEVTEQSERVYVIAREHGKVQSNE